MVLVAVAMYIESALVPVVSFCLDRVLNMSILQKGGKRLSEPPGHMVWPIANHESAVVDFIIRLKMQDFSRITIVIR